MGPPDIVRVPRNAEVEFVDRICAESFRDAQRKQLRAPYGESIEAGNAGAALVARVGIVMMVSVIKVVA